MNSSFAEFSAIEPDYLVIARAAGVEARASITPLQESPELPKWKASSFSLLHRKRSTTKCSSLTTQKTKLFNDGNHRFSNLA